jgi:hypothetical protein
MKSVPRDSLSVWFRLRTPISTCSRRPVLVPSPNPLDRPGPAWRHVATRASEIDEEVLDTRRRGIPMVDETPSPRSWGLGSPLRSRRRVKGCSLNWSSHWVPGQAVRKVPARWRS